MEITLFSEVTTEIALKKIETESASYDGLYVEMGDKEQRKFVKERASHITDLLKKVDRARIDLTKSYKADVEAEAKQIKERLESANKPFTNLIDEWKAERTKVLEAKKQKELAIQRELDHETAIMEDKVRAMEKREAEEAQRKLDEAIAKQAKIEAEEKAKQDLIDAENKRVADVERAKREEQERIKAEIDQAEQERLQREANQAHVKTVLTSVKEALMLNCGLDEQQARIVALAIKNKQIPLTAINF